MSDHRAKTVNRDSLTIHPVILCGGIGTRLWPASRALYPKQLLPLTSNLTMLQETVDRVANNTVYSAPLVICHEEHRFIVAEQFREIGVVPGAILLEPEGRNTAPATAAAAEYLLQQGTSEDSLILILPSDHVVTDLPGFQATVDSAASAAQSGMLVTFGMAPTSPETGYGYIRRGNPIGDSSTVCRIERFVEKPDARRAEAMIAEEPWLWNSGMFLMQIKTFTEELDRYTAEIMPICRDAVARGRPDLDFFRLDRESFVSAPNLSIDYAIMEHTQKAAVVLSSIGWSDAGSWSALWEIGQKDSKRNVTLGDAILHDVEGSYIRAESRCVAAIGLRDIVVVETADAVLVTTREQAQRVKTIVEHLRGRGSDNVVSHLRVYRPWGYYENLETGPGFRVKHISIKPGAKLSLQTHRHRAEHWVVVAGLARVTRDGEAFELKENESVYIPIGIIHRLENAGRADLSVIEVQSGDYIGEDDIVRLEDDYGRENPN